MEIFIADVTDDLRLSKKRLIKKLEERKATVHYKLPPPYLRELHDQLYNATIAGCEVSVHILSQFPGRTFEDAENVFILKHQAEVGLKGKTLMVMWIPKSLELEAVDEDEYRDFLSLLDFGIEGERYILLKGDPQTLDTDILNVLPFSGPVLPLSGTLIVHHSKDEDGAIRVSQQANPRSIETQYNTSGDDNPSTNLKILADQLHKVDQVIIVVGAVDAAWAKERAKHILSTIIQHDLQIQSLKFYFTRDAEEIFSFNGYFITVKVLEEMHGEKSEADWDTYLSI